MKGNPCAAAAAFVVGVLGACGAAIAAEVGIPDRAARPEIGHPAEIYGKALPIQRDMGVGPTMAARVAAGTLYSIGRGKLRVFDISNPADPKPLGALDGLGATRQIEVQNQVAYITSREDGVFIVGVANPGKPRLLCHYDSIEVATGIDVSGDVMFVACRLYGVELVDVSDPEKPRHLSTARTGEAQSVEVRNGYAYVGVWGSSELVVVDVRNPRVPKITARCPLDGFGDVVAAPGLAKPCRREPDKPPVIPPFRPEPNPRFRVYRPDGQVRAVALLGEVAVVAAGSAGVCLVRLSPELVELKRYPTEGFAMEVKVLGDRVYVAEERGGLSIWRHTGGGALSLEGRYAPPNRIVKDVVVPAPGKYAVVQVGMATLDVVDVSNPAEPKRVFRDAGHGFVYHLGEDLIERRRVCVLFQLGGLRWYDLYGTARPGFSGLQYAHRLGGGGTVPFGHQRLVTYGGGLLPVAPGERRPPSELGVRRIPEGRLAGKPVLHGKRLYVADARFGDIQTIDISDIDKPVLVEHVNLPGNPARLVLHNGALVIPNGYEGLWLEREPVPGRVADL